MRCKSLLWLVLLLFPLCALATGDTQEVALLDAPPRVFLLAPQKSASWESGGRLTVTAEGLNVACFDITLTAGDEQLTQRLTGETVTHTFTLSAPPATGGTLTVRGYADPEPNDFTPSAELTHQIPSPKEELIEKMIALAYANSKDKRYKFAPAEEDWDIGVCKNFVMRLFDTYSADYRMLAYPDLALHMPKNNSKAACAPYDYGIEWRPETAEDGSPFEIAAQFKYDNALTKEENAEKARNLLVQIRKGDFFQIVGYYGGGNGPHSMYIIRDYDPVTQMIHWTDSNMRGTRINGVRWGYMQYDADADVDWWVEVFNRPKRGATLYRLRDDLYRH